MKNFTNNFKQFTSRLSARWLIMVLMMLVGTSSAWAATIYLDANYNGNNWTSLSANIWACNGSINPGTPSGSNYVQGTKVADGIYKFTVTWSTVKFLRTNPSGNGLWNNSNAVNVTDGYTYLVNGWSNHTPIAVNLIVAGSINGKDIDASIFGTAWSPTTTANKMTFDETNKVFVKEYLTDNTSDITIAFKITGGSWDYAWPGSNKTHTISKGCKKTIIKFDLSGSKTDVSATTSDSDHCCPAPEMPTATVEKHTTKCSGTDRNQGVIKLTNYNSAYTYKLGNGTVSVSSDGKMSGLPEGKYYITAVSSCGAETKTTSTFDVNVTDVTPVATVKVTGDNEICSGETTTLTATVTATLGTVSSYSWSPNDGTKDGNKYTTPALTKTTSYLAQAKLTNDNCEKTVSATAYTITVKTAPEKPAVTLLPAEGNIISGNKATLSVSSPVNGATYTLYEETRGKIEEGKTSFEITEAGTYYVKGANDCGESPASENKTITVCTPNATLLSATYNQQTDKIELSGNLTETCGKTIYYGFLWKVKGDDWNTNNAISGTGNSYNSTSTNNTAFNQSWADAEDGTTYVFTAYALNTATNPHTWYYNETGIEVSKCITVATPDIDPVAICAGSTATLTLKNKQNGVTYTLGDGSPIFTDGTTHTVKPNGTTTYTITATSTNSCVANQKETATVTVTVNAVPSLSPSATVSSICEGETKRIKITTNAESIQWYKDGAAVDGETSAALDITEAGIYYAIVSNASGCSNQSINFEVANAFGSDITPTISGTTSVQSGATGVEYSTAEVSGAKYEWVLPTGWTFSGDKDGNQITVSVPDTDGDGTITVRITKNSCTKTATLDVAWMDGFTVYLRRPHAKNETTQYNYWFEKSTAAGPGYIKFGTVKASPSTAEIYTYNGGSGAETAGDLGTKGTESFTDCDGYVWDAYNIGIDVTALYFHAPNDKSTNGSTYGGHATYTRSYSQDTPISSDLYFTMGNWSNGTKGRTLTKVEKPFEGIEIEALGDTEICSNNMASFAALYLSSNCTGKSVKSYAWKVSSDEESWDDYTTGKGATSNNIRPNVAGHYRLECELEDGSKVESNSIEITTKTCTISNSDLNNITSNLPIIMVQTGENDFPSVSNGKHCSASADDLKKKRSVDVKILWNKNGTVTSTDAYSNGANLYYDRKARMNYRGSSSLNFEKKSFAFCPGDENCGQDDDKSADYVKTKKMNMFGIGEAEDKDWVLYAAYVDPSMMRNILAMETYSVMTGKWGVKNQYVELYIDGEYQGVYVFMDKVTQNKKRVDVKWDVKDDTKREFILKFDKTDAADRYELSSGDQKTFESDMTGKTGISTYDTEVDQRFEIEYPEKEDIEDDGGYWSDVYSFVLGKVNEFESALSKGDFTTVRNLINYESWADFFILNEFTKNVDAYRASCVFVYTDGKFEAWPLWDYELSFNNTVTGSGKGRGETTGLLIEHSDVYSDEFPAPFWWTGKYNGSNMYSGLLKDPCFLQKIKERWALHTKAGGPLNPSTTTAKTAAYKAILDANGAATREFTKWPVTSRGKDACNGKNTGYFANGGGGANTTYENSYSQLNTWLGADKRIKGLQAEIDELDDIIEFGITSTVDKDETTPWRAVNVKVDAVGADYTYTVTPEIIEGQVIQGSDNLLIYAEPATLPQTYTVVTTLNAKDQCGGKDADNASSTVTFTVNHLEDNCEE